MSEQNPAVWVLRHGRHGEGEDAALSGKCAVIGFDEFPDLAKFGSPEQLVEFHQRQIQPGVAEARSRVRAQQLWAFKALIKVGDIIALPLKSRPGQIAFGKVTGPFRFREILGASHHTRDVEWTHPGVPRSTFRQDLLHSFGSLLTVCRVQRNNAERRVQEALAGHPDPGPPAATTSAAEATSEAADEGSSHIDLEQAASDEIVAFIRARFRDHDMARLVDAILQAQGFQTLRSSPGPDGGADILAGSGPLGLDAPFLCVQVKATEGPTDVKVFRELAGTMSHFKATQGLLVSWGGFTQAVVREARQESFKIRLWDQSDLVKASFLHYDKLDPDLQAELPLKRVWVLVREDEDAPV